MRRTLLFALACLSLGTAAAQYRRAILLHHSVGGVFWDRSQYSNLTPPTTLPKEIAAYNTAHGYSGSNAVSMTELYFPNQDASGTANNDWSVWNTLFSGGSFNGSTMDFSTPVIIIKTCYLQQQEMTSSADIATLQGYIRSIVKIMANHPGTFFVIWNNYPAATDGASTRAVWSAQFSDWMKDVLATGNDSYGPFPRNVYVFDVFRKLADGTTGVCPAQYGSWSEGPGGDHPSNAAVAIVDPQFIQETFDAAIAYEGAASAPTAPAAGAATGVTSSSFTANWSVSAGATGSRLDVSTSNGFGTFVTGYSDKDIGNATNAGVAGLSPGTTYYYRVRAYNGVGTSGSSATITVTTTSNASVPSAPAAAAATGISANGFTANWSSSTGATGYDLDVAIDNAFSLYVAGFQNRDVSSATSFGVSGLSAGTPYYYRVRAYNSTGTSGNSATIPVTTLAPTFPAPPTAFAATSVTSSSFIAGWSSSAGATGYDLDVFTAGGTDSTLHVGDSVRVTFSTDGVNARTIPSTGGGSTVLKLELAGTRGIIVAGPSPDVNGSSSYTFWQVTYSDGITGWSAGVYLTKILGSYASGYNNKDVGSVTNAGVSGLSSNTPYFYRLRAYNASGAGGNSNTISVTTLGLASAPIVSTGAATGITGTGMQLNGSVNPNGSAATYHFDYGTTTGYGQSTSNQNAGSGPSAVAVNAVLTGLTPGTVYHFRVVATNGGGPASGNDSSAATAASQVPPPTVGTAPAASPTATGAQLNGTVNPNGFITTCYFEYGPAATYGLTTPLKNLGAGLTPIAVTAVVSGLSAGTLYHYRLVAQNNGGTARGVDTTFVTTLVSPREYVLLQNYPNPFNPTTTIMYILPHRTFVTLTVFNTLGQPITALVSGEQDAGSHQAIFDGSNLSSGTYFYRLQTEDDLEVKRIVLVH